jgi:hypothetical protein
VERDAPVEVAPGVVYRLERFTTAEGRQPVHVLEVDLREPDLRVGVVEACDRVVCPPRELLTSMARRAGALAGVNGDFFDNRAGTGRPRGGVMADGRLLKSPLDGKEATLVVRRDGTMAIGPRTWRGTATGGGQRLAVHAVNDTEAATGDRVVWLTPELGRVRLARPGTVAYLRQKASGGIYTVQAVERAATAVRELKEGESALLGGIGALAPGTVLQIGGGLLPKDNVRQLIGGGAVVVSGGREHRDEGGKLPRGRNPETAVGLDRTGTHAIVAVFDGRGGDQVARGVTPEQVAGYFLFRGLVSGILLDGGGSSAMVAQLPGGAGPEVLNRPSDGRERPVANGLFFSEAGEGD